jgi:hypothetical protein
MSDSRQERAGLAPRLAVEVGGAVEEPDRLRHIVRDGERTYCGRKLRLFWPRVSRPTERAGFWCRLCLDAICHAPVSPALKGETR